MRAEIAGQVMRPRRADRIPRRVLVIVRNEAERYEQRCQKQHQPGLRSAVSDGWDQNIHSALKRKTAARAITMIPKTIR